MRDLGALGVGQMVGAGRPRAQERGRLGGRGSVTVGGVWPAVMGGGGRDRGCSIIGQRWVAMSSSA
jgi:hypothetical protein